MEHIVLFLIFAAERRYMKTVTKHQMAREYYGIWGDDGMTDDEFVDELKSLRSFNRDIIEHI